MSDICIGCVCVCGVCVCVCVCVCVLCMSIYTSLVVVSSRYHLLSYWMPSLMIE